MKPSDVASALRAAITAGRPPYLSGPPGAGKSSVVANVAADMGLSVTDLRTSLLDPVDLRGLPLVADGVTRWAPPEFLPREGPGLLFLDELPNAPAAVQSALLQLVLDRRLGEYILPDDVAVVAAGNRVQDRAGSARLISSLRDRFIQLDFEPDADDWIAWALPAGIATEVLAFIRYRPGLLSDFDPAAASSPTPRSWAAVSDVMPHLSPDIEFDVFMGIVGEGAAAEFVGFLDVSRHLPDPDGVLMDPNDHPLPEDPAALYALCGALAYRASGANAERLITVADRMQDEFGVLLVSDAYKRNRDDFCNTRAYIDWATRNKDVLI